MTEIWMSRNRELLLLGLGSVAAYIGAVLLFDVLWRVTDGRISPMILSPMWVYVPGLVLLGYAAGKRQSRLGVLLIVVLYLVTALVYSAWQAWPA